MTISELIERLEALKAEHGDRNIRTLDWGGDPDVIGFAWDKEPDLGYVLRIGHHGYGM